MRASNLFALNLAVLAACGGSGGTSIDPTVSGISPALIYRARTVDLAISGDATRWTSQVTVDAGPGITVQKVTAASPTALSVRVSVADDAPLGPRTITVHDGGSTETLTDLLDVESPWIVKSRASSVSALQGLQGGFVGISATLVDMSTPFDDVRAGDGLLTPFSYPDLAVIAPVLTESGFGEVTPLRLEWSARVDVLTPAGPLDLVLLSGPPSGPQVRFPAPGALQIEQRTPSALLVDSPPTAAGLGPDGVSVFSLSTSQGTFINRVSLGSLMGSILPASGRWADALVPWSDSPIFPSATAATYYLVAYESGAASPTVAWSQLAVPPPVSETEPNATAGAANAIAPPVIVQGVISDATDQDWYCFALGAGAVGKSVRTATIPGNPQEYQSAVLTGATGTTFFDALRSAGALQDTTWEPITQAGTYCVQVTGAPTAGSGAYELMVLLE